MNESNGCLWSSDKALQIARLDAEWIYKDLTEYRITVTLEQDGWHVDYDLKVRSANGGGPHYVLDAVSGTLVSKKYVQ